jgi:hypothetical protein
MLKSLSRFLSAALVVSMLGATMPAPVSARMIGSEETLSAAQVDADRATISAWLARAEVRDELVAMGVSPAEVEARVAALGDDEIRDLAGKVGTAPAGAGIVGALVFVFVVLLVTDILGLTKVFPFTRSVR